MKKYIIQGGIFLLFCCFYTISDNYENQLLIKNHKPYEFSGNNRMGFNIGSRCKFQVIFLYFFNN